MVTYPVSKGESDPVPRPLPGREADVIDFEDRVVSVNHVNLTRSSDVHEVPTRREGEKGRERGGGGGREGKGRREREEREGEEGEEREGEERRGEER